MNTYCNLPAKVRASSTQMQDEVKVTTTEERGGWIQGGSEYQAKLGNEGGPQHSLGKTKSN